MGFRSTLELDAKSFNAGMENAAKTGRQSLGKIQSSADGAAKGVKKIGDVAASMAGPAGGAIRLVISQLTKLGGTGIAVAGSIAAIAFAFAAPITAAMKLANVFVNLKRRADALDMNVNEWLGISKAIRDAGVSADKFTQLYTKVQSALDAAADGNRDAIYAFRSIGLSWAELQRKSPAQAFKEIVKACKDLKAAGKEIPPIFETLLGRKGMLSFKMLLGTDFDTNAANGASVSDETLESAQRLIEVVNELKDTVIDVIGNSEGIKDLLIDVMKFIQDNTEVSDETVGLVDMIAKGLSILLKGVQALMSLQKIQFSGIMWVLGAIAKIVGFIPSQLEKIPAIGKYFKGAGDFLNELGNKAFDKSEGYWNDALDPYDPNQSRPRRKPRPIPESGSSGSSATRAPSVSEIFAGLPLNGEHGNYLKQFYNELDKSGNPAAVKAAQALLKDIQDAFKSSSSKAEFEQSIDKIYYGLGSRIPNGLKELSSAYQNELARDKVMQRWGSGINAGGAKNASTSTVYTTDLTSRGGFATGGFVSRTTSDERLYLMKAINQHLQEVLGIQKQELYFFKN